MNILVTGGTGFIASQIVTDLLAVGHSVTLAVRNAALAKQQFPHSPVIICDFIKDTNPEIWLPRLKNIDVIINCVGILHHPREKIIWAIHYDTPRALFDACTKSSVKKIIQISALGIDQVDVPYAKSKKAAEEYLLTLSIPSIILRPSLVYGKGSYGGTSLFRGLSGLPYIIPVPGKGDQQFQPILLNDLSKVILNLLEKPQKTHLRLSAVGPQTIHLKNILTQLRTWLTFKKAIIISMPLFFIKLGSVIGNLLPNSSLNRNSYNLLLKNNIASEKDANTFREHLDFSPKTFDEGLYNQPSTVQDHWHARLYFLKPLLQYSIAFIWIWSGIASAFLFPKESSLALLSAMDVPKDWQSIFLYGASGVDILLGLCTLCSIQLKKVGILQCLFIVIYTIIITIKAPHLWLEPFMPIAKNIPLLVATFIMLALESDR
ncbi:MAG TPA: NAD(P)H-binding protein [Gammaproteobacteria bacterium]|jgi:uncharacterized protein YbjT (DUF2867 family)|nr:NAD(P)H-binding protein [Gammaproteobacteria bacterium]